MKSLSLLISLTCLCFSACLSADEKPMKKVVFLGDSITQQGAGPKGYVTLVKQALKQQDKTTHYEIIGAGISGNRVPDLQKRLEKDVLVHKPDVVVIYIGINDVWHTIRDRGTPVDQFEAGLIEIVQKLKKAEVDIILCTPSVIGEKHTGENPLDGLLALYSGVSRKIAFENELHLLDLHDAFHHHLEKVNPDNKEKGILTTDGVHLNESGNQFVAQQMLKALGVAPMPQRVLRHVVLFKFKDDVTKEQIQEVVDAFGALPDKIDTIIDFEAGTDVSVENKSEGLTHGFVVTFRDEKGRDIYLPHPAHQEFVKLVGPRLDKVLVFDYYTK